jgi:hypothetical protein
VGQAATAGQANPPVKANTAISGTSTSPIIDVDYVAPATTQSGGPNGLWYVSAGGLTHELSSQLPGGPWFSEVQTTRVPGVPAVK